MTQLASLLTRAFQAAPSADNSQPYSAEWKDGRLTIQYDSGRVAGETFPADSPATLISLGAIIENLSEVCDSLKLKYITELNLDSADISATITIADPQDITPSTEKLGVWQRHTNRLSYKSTAVDSNILKEAEQCARESSKVTIYDSTESRGKIWALVKSASEIRFQTREVHEWLGKSLRFTQEEIESGDGLDINTLDLPPGGSLFMKFIADWKRMNLLNKLGAYKLLSSIDSDPIRKGPAIIAITGPATAAGAINAGRSITKVWNHLNAKGVAAHPYFVIADQLIRLQEQSIPEQLLNQAQQLKQDSIAQFSLAEGETLYMLLRVGYPKRQPKHSRRLPTDKVFKDLTLGE